MNTRNRSILILAVMWTVAAQARAGGFYGVVMDVPPAPTEQERSWEHHHFRNHHESGVSPVVVLPGGEAYPVYVPVAPFPAFPGRTGDYASDLANFNEKLSRARRIVQRQTENGSISAESADRLMTVLDGVERDARSWAFDNMGNLTDQNFAELYRRLDQTNEDIQIALAE